MQGRFLLVAFVLFYDYPETMREGELLQNLNRVFNFARHNTYSDLYKNLYKNVKKNPIHDISEWSKIPFLTKNIIAKYPLDKRLFIPRKNISFFKLTSGTSNGIPLLVPRNLNSTYTNFFRKDKKSRGVLHFLHPQMILENASKQAENPVIFFMGDPANLEKSIALASHTALNHIFMTPSLLVLITPILEKYNLTRYIEYIDIAGEPLSREQIEYLCTTFPKAHIQFWYALTEFQGMIGMNTISKKSSIAFITPLETTYIELVSQDGKVILDENIEGEIVLTQLFTNNNPFPLLRYKTGDYGRIIKKSDNVFKQTYEVLGRLEHERIKVSGGVLEAREIERVLYKFNSQLTQNFILYFTTKHLNKRPIPSIEIHIQYKDTLPVLTESEAGLQLAEKIRISPHFTYADGVRSGHFHKLTCKFVKKLEKNSTKKLRFVTLL